MREIAGIADARDTGVKTHRVGEGPLAAAFGLRTTQPGSERTVAESLWATDQHDWSQGD